MRPRRVRLRPLLVAELRALRWSGASLWAGAGLPSFLTIVLLGPARADGDGFDFFLLLSCFLVPTLLGPYACHVLVVDRATGFDEGILTAPLTKGRYLAARPGWTSREYLVYFDNVQDLDVDPDALLDLVGIPAEARRHAIGGHSTALHLGRHRRPMSRQGGEMGSVVGQLRFGGWSSGLNGSEPHATSTPSLYKSKSVSQ